MKKENYPFKPPQQPLQPNSRPTPEITGYSTAAELDFVQYIGEFSSNELSKLAKLKGYKKGCLKRMHWGSINNETVMAALNESIHYYALLEKNGLSIFEDNAHEKPTH